jgi:hypothetical protein
MVKILLIAAYAALANTVRDCSSGKSLFKFQTASLLPDPVVPGQNSTLSLSCLIPADLDVTEGIARYTYTFNGIPFSPTEEDLCSQVECPLLPGLYSNSSTSIFPSVSGKIVTKLEWLDMTKTKQYYCLEVTTRV